MARDFTFSTFIRLLHAFMNSGYSFLPLTEFPASMPAKVVLLRHDVDRHPERALRAAIAEHEMGIRGTYFFRCSGGSFEGEIIRRIAGMGHDTGYHYEDLMVAGQRLKGERRKSGSVLNHESNESELASAAFESFSENLAALRKIVPVKNICMHGSPTSRFDSRLLWKYNNYRELGVMVEPYFDYCVEDTLYLTDTGRRWDGASFSLRDRSTGEAIREPGYFAGWKSKPLAGSLMNMTDKAREFQGRYRFRSTHDIISALKSEGMPQKIMITFHPQRWNDKLIPWTEELIFQKMKNAVKYLIIRIIIKQA